VCQANGYGVIPGVIPDELPAKVPTHFMLDIPAVSGFLFSLFADAVRSRFTSESDPG